MAHHSGEKFIVPMKSLKGIHTLPHQDLFKNGQGVLQSNLGVKVKPSSGLFKNSRSKSWTLCRVFLVVNAGYIFVYTDLEKTMGYALKIEAVKRMKKQEEVGLKCAADFRAQISLPFKHGIMKLIFDEVDEYDTWLDLLDGITRPEVNNQWIQDEGLALRGYPCAEGTEKVTAKPTKPPVGQKTDSEWVEVCRFPRTADPNATFFAQTVLEEEEEENEEFSSYSQFTPPRSSTRLDDLEDESEEDEFVVDDDEEGEQRLVTFQRPSLTPFQMYQILAPPIADGRNLELDDGPSISAQSTLLQARSSGRQSPSRSASPSRSGRHGFSGVATPSFQEGFFQEEVHEPSLFLHRTPSERSASPSRSCASSYRPDFDGNASTGSTPQVLSSSSTRRSPSIRSLGSRIMRAVSPSRSRVPTTPSFQEEPFQDVAAGVPARSPPPQPLSSAAGRSPSRLRAPTPRSTAVRAPSRHRRAAEENDATYQPSEPDSQATSSTAQSLRARPPFKPAEPPRQSERLKNKGKTDFKKYF